MTIIISRNHRAEGNALGFTVWSHDDQDGAATLGDRDSPLLHRLLVRYDRPHEFAHHLAGKAAVAFDYECARLLALEVAS